MQYDAGSSNLVLCVDLEEWDGVGGRFKRKGTDVCLFCGGLDGRRV